jgi:hypothetical protein
MDWMRGKVNSMIGKTTPNATDTLRFLPQASTTNETLVVKGEFISDPDTNPSLLDDIGYLIIIVAALILVLILLLIGIALSKRFKR